MGSQLWGAIVEVDNRAGGTMAVPGRRVAVDAAVTLPGEHNVKLLAERKMDPALIQELRQREILLSRNSLRGEFDEA